MGIDEEHMGFTSDGLVLTIEHSKTDQLGAGKVIALRVCEQSIWVSSMVYAEVIGGI